MIKPGEIEFSLTTDEAGRLPEANCSPRAGSLCPACRQGILDYNGVLELSCPSCGYAERGSFT